MSRPYQICTRCIMDTNDYPDIVFDENGVCNVCHIYEELAKKTIKRGQEGKIELNNIIEKVKSENKNREYNCMVGISGGVDSTYLTYLTKQWGLRPLVVHIDNGWNSEMAVNNIKTVLQNLNLDLYTYVVDWEEMRDIQLSFIKASVIDTELPFDNMFVAALFRIARKHNIKNLLMGYNTETEGWIPPSFNHFKYDSLNLKAIQKKFGTRKLKTFPIIGYAEFLLRQKIGGLKMYNLLNYIDYNKENVKQLLINELGWKDYGYKHYENIFTRFYQGYILPQKFKIDKRKSHLSTLICSKQITRAEALEEIKKSPYGDESLFVEDKEYVIKKLGISESEFDTYMNEPVKKHTDFPSYLNIINKLRKVKQIVIVL